MSRTKLGRLRTLSTLSAGFIGHSTFTSPWLVWKTGRRKICSRLLMKQIQPCRASYTIGKKGSTPTTGMITLS
ncbi:hypothetical protein DPMN_163806 [Dreissena polymorpha]|uniref:Uncharacterized protein n=1 Tax=Dreissena polymorpha TaxID=45954 RepID=A0A9D4ESW7_DREPO|nr:hypothetical protein DPMN_163642 [Dreissena polymorpha]KAH3785712.1 hypothetical protein DPMN_163806 [Dreissena polymorpha]